MSDEKQFLGHHPADTNGDGSVSAATITVSSNMIASNYNSTTSSIHS